jgi:photosystem II stability/assembly factor-like uncharacterized protein
MRERSAPVLNKLVSWLVLAMLAPLLVGSGVVLSSDVPSPVELDVPFFRPIPDDLFGVSFANQLHGWASGYYGSVLKTIDGGSTWSHQETGTEQLIRRVRFVNEKQGWAVGHRGSVYKSSDGGSKWIERTLERGLYLRSLDFVSSEVGWVVGHEATIFSTRDGGETWARQSLMNFKGRDLPRLSGIAAVTENIAVAVGEFGTVAVTYDGGSTWKVMPPVTTSTLTAVAATQDYFVAVGLDGAALTGTLVPTHTGELRVLPTSTKEHLFDIGLNEQGQGIAVGRAVALEVKGFEFKPVTVATPFDRRSTWLGGVAILPDGRAYAVGNGGHILRLTPESGHFSVIYQTAASGLNSGGLSDD